MESFEKQKAFLLQSASPFVHLHQWCPTYFVLRSTFQEATLPRSTSPVSTSQTHSHRFQPAVAIFTILLYLWMAYCVFQGRDRRDRKQ